MKQDLRRLMISETEMYAANGLGHVLDALREYEFSMTRNIDNTKIFLATVGSLGIFGVSFISLAVTVEYIGWGHPASILPGILGMAGSIALYVTRNKDFKGRYILKKLGKEAYERYLQYCAPVDMQKRLYEEVAKFNKLVRAIHVSDEIDAAGAGGAKIQDRETLLKSMAINRTDLIRALKIERVRRENADIAVDFQLFNVDLTQIAAMQVEDSASQYGRMINEAFQIAQTVQVEVKKLQIQDRTRV